MYYSCQPGNAWQQCASHGVQRRVRRAPDLVVRHRDSAHDYRGIRRAQEHRGQPLVEQTGAAGLVVGDEL